MGILAIDIGLFKQRECSLIARATKLLDFSSATRFLTTKLIARKAKYFKSTILKLRIDILQASILVQ